MKTRKGLICLLAGLMTVSMAFSACDAQEIYNSVIQSSQTESSEDSSEQENAESSLESSEIESSEIVESVESTESIENVESSEIESNEIVESVESVESPESSEETSEETSEEESSSEGDKNYADDEALAILQAAIEKSLLYQNNYTAKTDVTDGYARNKGSIDGVVEEGSFNYTVKEDIKRDGKKLEEVEYQNFYNIVSPEAPFTSTSDIRHTIEVYTNEEETEGIYYDYEDGEWTKGHFSAEAIDADDIAEIEKFYQQMKAHLQYDEETKIYYVENQTFDVTDLEGIEGVKNSVVIYKRMEIELKDGYIYRFYVDSECYTKVEMSVDGVEYVHENWDGSKATQILTNWGTTVVTLPTIAEN